MPAFIFAVVYERKVPAAGSVAVYYLCAEERMQYEKEADI